MRIAYVEDNITNQALVERVARMTQHVIVPYSEGEIALEALRSEPFDLIMMDIELAGNVNGLDVVRNLRAAGLKTPIIAVTAYAMMGDRDRCLEAGCNDYLPKPIPIKDLLDLLGRYDARLKANVEAGTPTPADTPAPAPVATTPVPVSMPPASPELPAAPVAVAETTTPAPPPAEPVSAAEPVPAAPAVPVTPPVADVVTAMPSAPETPPSPPASAEATTEPPAVPVVPPIAPPAEPPAPVTPLLEAPALPALLTAPPATPALPAPPVPPQGEATPTPEDTKAAAPVAESSAPAATTA